MSESIFGIHAAALELRSQRMGLIECHHGTPKTLPLTLRAAAEMFGQYVSLQIAVAERREEPRAATGPNPG